MYVTWGEEDRGNYKLMLYKDLRNTKDFRTNPFTSPPMSGRSHFGQLLQFIPVSEEMLIENQRSFLLHHCCLMYKTKKVRDEN